MSSQRLTFLYPQLVRSARVGEAASGCGHPSSGYSRARPGAQHYLQRPDHVQCRYAARLSTSSRAKQSAFAPRVGKAIEPKPLGDIQPAPALESQMKKEKPATAAASPATGKSKAGKAKSGSAASKKADSLLEDASSSVTAKPITSAAQDSKKVVANAAPTSTTKPTPTPSVILSSPDPPMLETLKTPTPSPIDVVLKIPNPEELSDSSSPPPHLSAPPYVHHFDSYTLVKDLEKGGFTQDQAITTMKAVRGLLAQHLDVAQLGLVSKSDVENETYLFRAACSELGTEVTNTKRVREDGIRQQRTMLQNELDVVSQSLTRELATLGDNVRGMFDDRKMTVREEQKNAESSIQQINYKINVALNSDSRSEIEAMRWTLARRAIVGILLLAAMSFGALRYSRHHAAEAAKREAEQERADALRHSGDGKADRTLAPDAVEILAAN